MDLCLAFKGGVDFFGGKYLELCEIGYIFVRLIVICLFY